MWLLHTIFDCFSSEKKKRKRQRGANKKEKKKPHQQKKTKKEKAAKKKIQKCLHPFVVLQWVVLLFSWTRSRTGLGQQHRLSWDYFSVLQFWIENLIFLATILCLSKAPQILLSAQVHLATVTLKLHNRLYHPVGFGKNTCKTVISRLRYCNPLSHLSVLVVTSW